MKIHKFWKNLSIQISEKFIITIRSDSVMNKKEKWEKFKKSGKIEDYIDYKKED